MRKLLIALAAFAAAAGMSGPALSDDRATVERLYGELLTVGGSSDLDASARSILADDWESIGDYSGKAKDRTTFVKQLGGFMKLMPDMDWKVEEIIQSGNRYIVRSHASGTPQGPLFGVEPSGRSFHIMTIDIHTVENGKIARTFHVEDWAGALAQLKAK